MEYVPLACHSWYSFLWGTDPVEGVCAAAARLGARALALTDRNGLHGAITFWSEAKEAGLAPIVGVDLCPANPAEPGAVLLAASTRGYRRLCRIVTDRHHAGEGFCLGDALREDREGLWVLVRDPDLLADLARATGASRLAAAVSPGRPHRRLVEAAARGGLTVAVAGEMVFVERSSYPLHRLLRAIALNTRLSRLHETDTASPSAWMMPPASIAAALPDLPGALEATGRIAAECILPAPPWNPEGKLVFPSFDGLTPAATAERLRALSLEGARRRYRRITPVIRSRLEKELDIIRRKGFADYFLVVHDIVRQSPRTCGRGSAAASIVSYCLGITHVDPVRHDLFFERFLNEGRVDPPDIDVDFAWDERDDVLEYVFARYGAARAAMVSNHLCFRGRAAVREVAKVYGLPEEEIRAVTGRLARAWQTDSAQEMVATHPLFRGLGLRDPWPEILAWSARLEGHPRHLSVHCGGVVIVPGVMSDHVPTQPAAKGVNIIQWEKDGTEDAGLVKVDLLGNRSIAVIRDALRAVRAHHGVEIPWERFQPLEDLRTQELIRCGDTVGVFYVESPAMRQLQVKTGTGDFEHLVIHSSIIRPAANRYIREYVRRLRGGAYEPLHPLLGELMRETHGIMVYQEDVAKAAIAMAGFDPASADDLRKVLSKKHKQKKLADYRARFEAGARARGFSDDVIAQVWEMILSFAGYSFCKPHSASYALVSFKSAYLKAHYPAEFMAAVISNQGGYYATFAYVSECRRMGLGVALPDINESGIHWTGQGRQVRVGLMQVQSLGKPAMEAIVQERERAGPFASLDDLVRRVAIDPGDVRLLIKAGAFDGVAGERSRPELMWQWVRWSAARARRAAPARTQRGLFDAPEGEPRAPSPVAEPYDERTVLRHEADTLGFLISRHPLTLFREQAARVPHIPARLLERHVGRRVTTIGWLVTAKMVTSKDDEPMEFVSFEDTTALYETTLFPEAYRRFCHMLSHTEPYVLRGRVEEDFGAITLTIEAVEFLKDARLSASSARPRPARARHP